MTFTAVRDHAALVTHVIFISCELANVTDIWIEEPVVNGRY